MGSSLMQNRCTELCESDFEKARMALEKANVTGTITVVVNTKNWSKKQWKLYKLLKNSEIHNGVLTGNL